MVTVTTVALLVRWLLELLVAVGVNGLPTQLRDGPDDAWRRGWPDCALKVTGFKREEEGGYRAEIFVDVERSVFGSPGPLLDQFRNTVRFGDSDDLVINFCQTAQGVTDNFYDWQQQWVRQAFQKG